jgi:DNA-directed RNA polymerase specialized sigma24 family protein
VHDAEEIWNDTFEACWRSVGRNPPIAPLGEGLRRYAFGVAQRLIARRRAVGQKEIETVPLMEVDQQRAEALPAQLRRPSRLMHAFRRCMEMASERTRLTVELSMYKASPEEFATALGIKTTSVRETAARAHRAIRRCVEGETDV